MKQLTVKTAVIVWALLVSILFLIGYLTDTLV
jgi:hypothetical protein